MRWKIPALLVTASLLAAFSYLANAGEGKENGGKDNKALQGTWNAAKGDKKISLTFDGDKFTLNMDGKSLSGTFKIDPTQKPGTIDMSVTKGSDAEAQKYEGKTSKGLYALDGNKLKWVANEPGKGERPDAFPKEGDKSKGKSMYLVFEREKK